MSARAIGCLAMLAVAGLGCRSDFRFNDDSGVTDSGFDAGLDAGSDAGADAGPDAGPDAGRDAGLDGGSDAGVDGGCVTTGECDCNDPTDCTGLRRFCDSDHRCVECLEAAQCGAKGLCDLKTHRCATSCLISADCDAGIRDRCDFDQPPHCVFCDDDPTCLTPPAPHCAESVGFCVECARDAQCDGGVKPYCDLRTGSCVECLGSAQCAGSRFCEAATASCQLR